MSHPCNGLRAALIVGLLAGGSCAARPVEVESRPSGFNVLFIGNSLTSWNEMPEMVAALLAAGALHGLAG